MEKQTLLEYGFYPSYEEYIRYCEIYGITPESKDSKVFSDFMYEVEPKMLLKVFTDCIRDDVKGFNYILEDYLMYFNDDEDDDDEYQKVFNSILEVLKELTRIGKFSLVKNGNTIYVLANPCDQFEFFKLHAISDIGLERFKRNGSISTKNKENIKSLPKNIFKTKK